MPPPPPPLNLLSLPYERMALCVRAVGRVGGWRRGLKGSEAKGQRGGRGRRRGGQAAGKERWRPEKVRVSEKRLLFSRVLETGLFAAKTRQGHSKNISTPHELGHLSVSLSLASPRRSAVSSRPTAGRQRTAARDARTQRALRQARHPAWVRRMGRGGYTRELRSEQLPPLGPRASFLSRVFASGALSALMPDTYERPKTARTIQDT